LHCPESDHDRQRIEKAANLRESCNFENVNLGTERGTVLAVIILDNRAGKYKDNGGKINPPDDSPRILQFVVYYRTITPLVILPEKEVPNV
jgi:hypothetical protein